MEFKYYQLSMEGRREIMDKLRELLKGEEGVLLAYVHGGFLRREFFRDVDLALWVEDPDRSYYYAVELAVRLQLEVGLPVDVQVLNEAPLPFRYRVLTEGVPILSRDEGLRARLEEVTVRQYLDLRYLLRSMSGNDLNDCSNLYNSDER